MPNSTQADEIIRLTAKLTEHEKRIATLESRLLALTNRIAGSDYGNYSQSTFSDYLYFGEDGGRPEMRTSRRSGRPPRIEPDDFARRRDEMVVFLEIRWPLLADIFVQCKSIDTIYRMARESFPGAQDTWQYRTLTDHLDQLWEFLQSGRYSGEPRQIAYAMAGLPELKWRSSLDWGIKHPSLLPIEPPALFDHIRRNNHRCLAILESQGTSQEALKLLKVCCAQCRQLAAKPDRVRKILEIGRVRT